MPGAACAAQPEDKSAGRARLRWSDAVPVGAASGDAVTGTVAVWLVVVNAPSSPPANGTVANGLTAGSGVHVRRLVGACDRSVNDVYGNVHGLFLRVAHSVDAVDCPALDRQTDRPEEDRLGLTGWHDGDLVRGDWHQQLKGLAIGDVGEENLIVYPDVGRRHGRGVRLPRGKPCPWAPRPGHACTP